MSKYKSLARGWTRSKFQPRQRMSSAREKTTMISGWGQVAETAYHFVTYSPSLSAGGITYPDTANFTVPLTSTTGHGRKPNKQMRSTPYKYSRRKYYGTKKRYRY